MEFDDATQCGAAKERAVLELGPPYSAHSSIVDIRDLRIHPQKVIGIFVRFVAETRHKSRRIAIVTGEGSARMQFRRVVEQQILRDGIAMFDDIGAATAWLKQPISDVA